MHFHRRFVVDAPLAEVRAFHARSSSMAAITPPPVLVRVHLAPEVLGEGDEMVFTIWLGPLPVHWQARIEQVTETGFVDRQVRGPFASWVHRHTFVPLDATRTEVVDHVEATLGRRRACRIVGLGMWLNMPVLFAYRGWRTRRILACSRDADG